MNIYLIEDKHGCGFQYGKEYCGKRAVSMCGRTPLCLEHTLYAMSNMTLFPRVSRGNSSFMTDGDFIERCKRKDRELES